MEQHHGTPSLCTFPFFLLAAVLGKCPVFFLLFSSFLSDVGCVPLSPGDTELHSIRKRWTMGAKSLLDVTSLAGQSFYLVSECFVFYFVIGSTIDFYSRRSVGRRNAHDVCFPDRKTVVFPSRLALCVCVCFVCVWVCDGFGDTFQSISRRSFFLPSSSFFFLLLWVASLFIFVK